MKTIQHVPVRPTVDEAATIVAAVSRDHGMRLTFTQHGPYWTITDLVTGRSTRNCNFARALATATGVPVVTDVPIGYACAATMRAIQRALA